MLSYDVQDEILNGFDDESRKFIKNIYADHGININTNTTPTKLEKDGQGKITMTFKRGEEEHTLQGLDQVLFATGRKPNTKGIGLEELKVELDPKGGVKVALSSQLLLNNSMNSRTSFAKCRFTTSIMCFSKPQNSPSLPELCDFALAKTVQIKTKRNIARQIFYV